MPINVTNVSWPGPAVIARNTLIAARQIPAPEISQFLGALNNAIYNWGMIALDTAAAPGLGVQGNGFVIYTNAAGNVQNYPVNWTVNVQNWVAHNSCGVQMVTVS